MNRLERPSWFAAGAGAMGLAAMLAIDFPAHEPAVANKAVLHSPADSRVVRQLELINERLGRLERTPTAAAPAASGASESTEGSAPAKPEAYEASMSAGREIVERAIEVGRWTHKDVAAFGAATATLEMPDRLVLHQRLIAAVNEDRVQLQGPAWQR
jgi:hypothetical protein